MPGIVNISEAASIAIHAMVLIAANPGRILPAGEIASFFGLSSTHLAKVMQRLVKAGLAVSTRGPAGGFKLGRPSRNIALLEIYETIEGPLLDGGCLLGREKCLGSRCILGDMIKKVNKEARQTLTDRTLADLTASFLSRAPRTSPTEGLVMGHPAT